MVSKPRHNLLSIEETVKRHQKSPQRIETSIKSAGGNIPRSLSNIVEKDITTECYYNKFSKSLCLTV